jgi:hypothetical protein
MGIRILKRITLRGFHTVVSTLSEISLGFAQSVTDAHTMLWAAKPSLPSCGTSWRW